MNVTLVTPAGATSLTGNRTTALRWRRLLEQLGHCAEVTEHWDGEPADVLIALHARKSFESIRRFATERPGAMLVVALTGTDLYGDLGNVAEVSVALEIATHVVVLQPAALERLPAAVLPKAHVILQSAEPLPSAGRAATDRFEVCVLAHLRAIKDPLLAAAATRHLPRESRIMVRHAGAEIDAGLGGEARAETETNPRYEWLGPLQFDDARSLLAGSRLLVLSSTDEGGANVVSEAIVAGVPVLSTDIPGSRGLLGDDYAGYYPVGDHESLARMLLRAESESSYLANLTRQCSRLRPDFAPEAERAAWRQLLDLAHGSSSSPVARPVST